ncbi:MAG TPA: hypothetical protein VHO70_01515 [Chitinispirillaceae bacterium]|nr:hypothetical protein [Chitinispirillaceae bacterium]
MIFLKIASLFILTLAVTSVAGKKTPIEINTVLNQFDSIMITDTFSISLRNVSLVDSLKKRPVGITRTGRKTSAPLICNPSLDTALYLSLEGFLKNKHLAAQSAAPADFILDLTILNARVTEVSSGLTQTMSAQLTIEIQLINPNDTTNRKTFIIEAANSMETLDTTKKAATIIRGAIETFIQELVKSIHQR